MWGNRGPRPRAVRGSGAELSFERAQVTFEDDVARGVARATTSGCSGPALMAKAALEPQGRYEELRGEMFKLYEDVNEADDGSFSVARRVPGDGRAAARLKRRCERR